MSENAGYPTDLPVKKLVWIESNEMVTASTPFGIYSIKPNGPMTYSLHFRHDLIVFFYGKEAVEEAKKSAQKDYESAIGRCLDMPKSELLPSTRDLVRRFSQALSEKLERSQSKYGFGDSWKYGDWEQDCAEAFRAHLTKGDPIDVAAYCAFMWHHGWSTSSVLPVGEESGHDDLDRAARVIWKYPLPMKERFTIDMPENPDVIRVDAIDGIPYLWAVVDPARPIVPKEFIAAKTGTKDLALNYVGVGEYLGHVTIDVGQELCLYYFEVAGEESDDD